MLLFLYLLRKKKSKFPVYKLAKNNIVSSSTIHKFLDAHFNEIDNKIICVPSATNVFAHFDIMTKKYEYSNRIDQPRNKNKPSTEDLFIVAGEKFIGSQIKKGKLYLAPIQINTFATYDITNKVFTPDTKSQKYFYDSTAGTSNDYINNYRISTLNDFFIFDTKNYTQCYDSTAGTSNDRVYGVPLHKLNSVEVYNFSTDTSTSSSKGLSTSDYLIRFFEIYGINLNNLNITYTKTQNFINLNDLFGKNITITASNLLSNFNTLLKDESGFTIDSNNNKITSFTTSDATLAISSDNVQLLNNQPFPYKFATKAIAALSDYIQHKHTSITTDEYINGMIQNIQQKHPKFIIEDEPYAKFRLAEIFERIETAGDTNLPYVSLYNKYSGSATLGNNIIFSPYNSDAIAYVDTSNDTFNIMTPDSNKKLHGEKDKCVNIGKPNDAIKSDPETQRQFYSNAIAFNNAVYFIPHNIDCIGQVSGSQLSYSYTETEPTTPIATSFNTPTPKANDDLSNTSIKNYFSSGVNPENSNTIYLVPKNHKYICTIVISDNGPPVFSKLIDITIDNDNLKNESDKFSDGVYVSSEQKIYFAPSNADVVGIYDVQNKTFSTLDLTEEMLRASSKFSKVFYSDTTKSLFFIPYDVEGIAELPLINIPILLEEQAKKKNN